MRTLLILAAFAACAGTLPVVAGQPGDDLAAQAQLIARRALIVDTHVDVPERLHGAWVDVTRRIEGGNFDYERARLGGLKVPFMSIYVSSEFEAAGGSFQHANQLIDTVEALVGRAPEKFTLVRTAGQAEEAARRGLIGLAMGMENGSPIEGKLENLRFFRDRGVSYITLAHALSNHIADSSYDTQRPWRGLSPFGREVVAEMNRLGIMVDISHVSDETFFQVLELSRAPVIASHSSARHFTPGFERNMSDEMIRALAAKGGVMQINFGSTFLTAEANAWFVAMRAANETWLKETGHAKAGNEAKQWREEYDKAHPFPFATLSQLVDHFDHVIALVGYEHVGLGSDFDGVGNTLPDGVKDVAAYPALIEEFLRRGYPVEQVEAILGGNLLRVWRAAEDVARELQASG